MKEVYSVLELLGIDDLAMRSFDELSAGQHQKVMLARGIIQKTDILILDEPTANLDIKHQMEVSKILSELVDLRDMMIIMISHDLNIASRYSDNVLMLSQGRAFALGAPNVVFTSDNLHTVYDVDSDIVFRGGRPYVILNDSQFESENHVGTATLL